MRHDFLDVSRRTFAFGILTVFLAGCSPLAAPSGDTSSAVDLNTASTPASTGHSSEHAPVLTKPRLTSFPKFTDIAEQSGVQFVYDTGATGKVYMVEAIGGGGGWIDFDGDGLLDLYLCQGGDPAASESASQPLDQLFRQVTPGQFQPVTIPSSVIEGGYSMGAAVADFDDDGFDDLFVTNYGPNSLFQNQGDGTFRELAKAAGVDNGLWSSSAAWGDLDGDGDLDLYVCTYVDYDVRNPKPCFRADGRAGTCHPKDMTPVPDECYFNQGDGRFTAEAAKRGLFGSNNKGLGVVIADLNKDGLLDVFVANDTCPNFLFINQGKGRFVESAKIMGCAVSRDGVPQANMGVAAGDYDQNGWLDLYVTHFTHESNTLYKNLGAQGFQDVTGFVGLHGPTLKYLAFGTIMADFNQDGHEDLFVANGHIDDWRSQGDLYRMPAQLFSYEGPRFVECSSQAGDYFQQELIGRGVARGDFDNDGDWDLAVIHQGTPAALLRNDSERGHWLKMRFIANANRRGIGTQVTLSQGTKTLVQEVIGGSSYCAAHEQSLIFGLGTDDAPCELSIRWPDGDQEHLENVTINQNLVIRQSTKKAAWQ